MRYGLSSEPGSVEHAALGSPLLTLHHKELKRKHMMPKVRKRKEIIKIRVKLNNIESRKAIENVNKSKRWFFEKIF